MYLAWRQEGTKLSGTGLLAQVPRPENASFAVGRPQRLVFDGTITGTNVTLTLLAGTDTPYSKAAITGTLQSATSHQDLTIRSDVGQVITLRPGSPADFYVDASPLGIRQVS